MESENKKKQIINKLAETIGVEPEDIQDDDFLVEDLHMNPAEISDFIGSLDGMGFDISKLELPSIETVSDLLEALGEHAEI